MIFNTLTNNSNYFGMTFSNYELFLDFESATFQNRKKGTKMQFLLITIEYMFVRRLFGDVDEITLALAKTILDELDIDMDGFLQPGEFDKGGRNIHLFI